MPSIILRQNCAIEFVKASISGILLIEKLSKDRTKAKLIILDFGQTKNNSFFIMSHGSKFANNLSIMKTNKNQIADIDENSGNDLKAEKIETIENLDVDEIENIVQDSNFRSPVIFQRQTCNNSKSFTSRVMDILEKFLQINLNIEINSRCAFNCLLILVYATLLSLPITMFLGYDLIQFPEVWLQEIFPYFLICAAFVLHHMFEISLVTNNHVFLTPKTLFFSLLIVTFMVHSEYIVINIIWMYSLKFHPPVPYIGQMCSVGLISSTCLAIWILRPIFYKTDALHRKRLKWYLILLVTRMAVYQGYLFIAALFEKFSDKYQVALAVATPLMKYVNNRIQLKIVSNCEGQNSATAKFSVNCNVACTHALYLAFVIGSTATNLTSFVICGLDALLGVLLCFKLYRQYKRSETVSEDFQKGIEALVTKEALEILLPVLYCIIFTLSYYGPNAEILGNVKADRWQYSKVDDIKTPLTKLGLFLLFDIIRITAAAGFLWISCRIDFFFEYCRIMGYYWKAILFNIFLYVTAVSKERKYI